MGCMKEHFRPILRGMEYINIFSLIIATGWVGHRFFQMIFLFLFFYLIPDRTQLIFHFIHFQLLITK